MLRVCTVKPRWYVPSFLVFPAAKSHFCGPDPNLITSHALCPPWIRCIWTRRSGWVLAVQGGIRFRTLLRRQLMYTLQQASDVALVYWKKTCAEQLAKTWWSTQESLCQLKPTRNRAQGYIYFKAGKGAESAVVLSRLHCIRAILCVKAHYEWKRDYPYGTS